MKNNKFIGLVVSLVSVAVLSGCSGSHTHTYSELYPEVPANCVETGTEAYYKCTDCDKFFDENKKEIPAPVVIPKDQNTHKGTKKLVLDSGYTNSYKVNDTFDLSTASLRWKCEHCDGVKLTTPEMNNITVVYPTEGAECFTADDVTRGVCTVKLNFNTYSADATVTVGKHDNVITGLTSLTGRCGYSVTELDKLELSATSGEEVTLYVSDSIDGEYIKRSQIPDDFVFNVISGDETVYYLKATSPATGGYSKAEAGPVTLTITHNENTWATERDDYDYIGCLCDPSKVIKYFKIATNISQLVLTNGTASLDLTGTSYVPSEQTVKEIKMTLSDGGVINLGNDLTNVPLAQIQAAGLFGAAEIEVVISTSAHDLIPQCDHLVKVPVNIVTAQISTKSDWENILPKASGDVVTGYFEVIEDLALDYYPQWISGWDKAKFSGIINGNGHVVILGQGTYGQFYVLENATIENLTFINNWWRRTTTNYALLTQKSVNTHYENLTFRISGYKADELDVEFEPIPNYGYLFNNGGAQGNSFVDCLFDFSGFKLPCLLSHSTNNTETNVFENSVLKCSEVTEIYYSNQNRPITECEGLTIEIRKSEVADMDAVVFDTSIEETVAITLPSKYDGYIVNEIYFNYKGNNIDLGKNLGSITLPSEVRADTEVHGKNYINVTLQKESEILDLRVPVLLVTQKITTVGQFSALTHMDGAQKTITGYYMLMNDLNFNTSDYTELTSTTYNIFKGTFDGNGKTITSKSRACGLFGSLDHATIKNFKMTDAWSYGGIDMLQTMLSLDMKDSTVENVEFIMTAKANREFINPFGLDKQNYGWINCRICQNTTFKNCTFDGGTTLKIQTLVGTHSSCVNITFIDCAMKCDQYYCLYQSSYTHIVTTTQEGITITGTCVYSA